MASDLEGHRNPCLGRSPRAGNSGESERGCWPLSGSRRHSPSLPIVPSPARTSGSVPRDTRAGYVTLPGHRSPASLLPHPRGGAWGGVPADSLRHCGRGSARRELLFLARALPNGESRSGSEAWVNSRLSAVPVGGTVAEAISQEGKSIQSQVVN